MLKLLIASSALLAVAGTIAVTATEEKWSIPRIGFGRQRLEKFQSRNDLKLADSGRNKDLKATSATTCENVEEFRFAGAVVDNFASIEDQQYWEGEGQRYWLNKQFWGGEDFPVFVYIGGEGEESCSRLTDRMYAFDLARQHQALLVNVEHRYYGKSYPTATMSTEMLKKYLSSAQALADLARVIGAIKKDLNTEKSQVVTIGGSYPGNLAAWFRLKYPSVTTASIASSAPVTAQTNFPEYMDVVGQSIIFFSGQACYDAFTAAAEAVAALAAQGFGSVGMKQLEADFATCSAITSDLDVAVLMSDLMGNVQGTVQYNNEHSGVMNITDICPIMTQQSTAGDVDAYANFVALQAKYRTANGQSCEDASWGDTVAYLSAPEMDSSNAARPWTFQTCNEFGYYQTTDSKNQPFSSWQWLNLEFSRAICNSSFDGWQSDPEVDWINQYYGDVRIAGTSILFPSGTIDPWHALGVTNYTASELPAKSEEKPVYIEGTAHCNDLYAPASSDPETLTYARRVIADQLNEWLL